MPATRFYTLLIAPIICAVLLFPIPAPVPVSAVAIPRLVPVVNVIVLPSCTDKTAFDAIVAALPARFLYGDPLHPVKPACWSVHEYSQNGWASACDSWGAGDPTHLLGCALFDCDTVIIRQCPRPSGSEYPVDIFWHEITHAVIQPGMTAAEQSAWNAIYAADKNRRVFVSPYAATSADEGLAEAVRFERCHPGDMQSAPAQKAFIETLLKN